MILCGIDSLKIERMEKSLKIQRFVQSVFSEYEQEYIKTKSNSYETAAGLWCAKEAFLKAYGTGIESLQLSEISVCHDERGAPHIKLSGDAIKKYHFQNVSLSITHTDDTATAIVIIEK